MKAPAPGGNGGRVNRRETGRIVMNTRRRPRCGALGVFGPLTPHRTVSILARRAHREMRAGRERDRGSVTVLVAAACAALVGVLVLGLYLAAAIIARHRAESAADLAALAGAGAQARTEGEACVVAAGFARANGAELATCEPLGWDIRVTVSVRVDLGPVSGSALGRARAGP